MSRNKHNRNKKWANPAGLNLSSIDKFPNELAKRGFNGWLKTHWTKFAAASFVFLLGLGVMAKNGWIPRTDPMSGKKTGWFGRELPKNASGQWNPLILPTPLQTPQLTKEYIYAGSRLLSSIDAGASEIPPADLAVWRPSNGNWYILGQSSGVAFGQSADIPVQGDYDGDGKTDFSVIRPAPTPVTWYISNTSTSSMGTAVFGIPGDIPVVADYDGDGKTDIAVWRSGNQHWYITLSSAPSPLIDIACGASGDVPLASDFDGDGKADLAFWRNSNHTFYWVNSSDSQSNSESSIGASGDKPVCSDYDGDGKADFAVFRNSNATWFIKESYSGQTQTIQYGVSGDTPVPNDYDADGKGDIAVWRVLTTRGSPAVWYIRQSSNLTTRTEYWGTQGDVPVPSYYRR